MRSLPILLAALIAALWTGHAAAHETRPFYLELREDAPSQFDVNWRAPILSGMALPVRPRFPNDCITRGKTDPVPANAWAIAHFRIQCKSGLAGSALLLDGLSGTMVDALVSVEFLSGQAANGLVRPTDPVFQIPTRSSALDIVKSYILLGIEHILTGIDHLMFITGLVLLVGDWRRLLTTITAFTAAHSITLSLAALQIIAIPVRPTEALIAFSIFAVALELVRPDGGQQSIMRRRPWLVAFSFGLLHGLGFASALREIGLPNHQIPAALLSFNVGVEIGQIIFLSVLLAVLYMLTKAPRYQTAIRTAAIYMIGTMSAFWMIDRFAAI